MWNEKFIWMVKALCGTIDANKELLFLRVYSLKQTRSSLLTSWTISFKASGVSAVGFWRTHEERRVRGVKRLRAKYCGGLQFCQQKQWLSAGVICLALPYGPHAGAGINERGGRTAGQEHPDFRCRWSVTAGRLLCKDKKKDGVKTGDGDWRERLEDERTGKQEAQRHERAAWESERVNSNQKYKPKPQCCFVCPG